VPPASLSIQPLAGALGAEISGIDLSQALDAHTFGEIRDAYLRYGAVFFRDQSLTREDQLALAQHFGKPEIHPIANGMAEHPEIIRVLKPEGEPAYFGTSWHSDNSFFEAPSATTVLYGETVPDFGGDTVFSSMELAWSTLSDPMRGFLEPLRAVHTAGTAYDPRTTGEAKYRGEAAISYTFSESIYDSVEHPVMRTHPETGRKSLYVNAMFTESLVGLNRNESDTLLAMLYEHSTRQELTCRFRWRPGSLAIWDNRCVQHYAIDDYFGAERVMYRVTIEGTRPV